MRGHCLHHLPKKINPHFYFPRFFFVVVKFTNWTRIFCFLLSILIFSRLLVLFLERCFVFFSLFARLKTLKTLKSCDWKWFLLTSLQQNSVLLFRLFFALLRFRFSLITILMQLFKLSKPIWCCSNQLVRLIRKT